jgi:8-amino-7-oxononanoate synthase
VSDAAPSPLAHLDEALADLEARGLRRFRTRSRPPSAPLVLCANDYLGYAHAGVLSPPPLGAALGAGASRLVAGDHPEHDALEHATAAWTRMDAALVFTSGYAANVGLLSALVTPADVVVSDALNHASIIDGCRLARPRALEVVAHRSPDAVERALAAHAGEPGRRYVVTESYFSMDGDRADLPRLRAIADAYGAALIIDEAHALGILGPEGAGLAAEHGVRPDALVGTFGKAVGAQGAFVAGSRVLTDWLWNRARSFVFSTGLSPAIAAVATEGVHLARADEAGRARLLELAARLRGALVELGYRVL